METAQQLRDLAAAIRKGHGMIGEDRFAFWNNSTHCGCALGAAYVARGGTRAAYEKASDKTGVDPLRDELTRVLGGISNERFNAISNAHFTLRKPRLQIADELDAEAAKLEQPSGDAWTRFRAKIEGTEVPA